MVKRKENWWSTKNATGHAYPEQEGSMKKILELHLTENETGEQYTIKVEQGISKLEATRHLMCALAEGLDEIQDALLGILLQDKSNELN